LYIKLEIINKLYYDARPTKYQDKIVQYQVSELPGSRRRLVAICCNRRNKYSSILSFRETISF